MRAFALCSAFVVLLAGCGDPSEAAPTGLEEPFRVSFVPSGQSKAVPAQFFRGELLEGTEGPETPQRTTPTRVVFPGEAGHKLSGNSGLKATGVGIRFDDIGSGYWVVPTTVLDVETPGTIKFDAILDFGRDVPPGGHTLKIVAIDGDGHSGKRADPLTLLFQPPLPTAAAVATLGWDNNADVDLQIVLPNGTQVDRKHPATLPLDADGGAIPGTGTLEHDSNANCIPDGRRQEMFIWPTDFPTGTYMAKADLFTACGEPGANFVFNFYLGGELKITQAGRFLAQDADNGSPGLAVVNFP